MLNPANTVNQSIVADYNQPQTAVSDEDTIWKFLIDHGYSRNQTAAIMGNLWQEHRFQTTDVPGGLGIAQWMGTRRDRLVSKGNYFDLRVQLEFLIEELGSTESAAGIAVIRSNSIEDATKAFQDRFERCNPQYCMLDKRIEYAHMFFDKH